MASGSHYDMPEPRKPRTKVLERSRRQFLQWYFVERLTLPDVKERMDKLSEVLKRVTGDDFVAPSVLLFLPQNFAY